MVPVHRAYWVVKVNFKVKGTRGPPCTARPPQHVSGRRRKQTLHPLRTALHTKAKAHHATRTPENQRRYERSVLLPPRVHTRARKRRPHSTRSPPPLAQSHESRTPTRADWTRCPDLEPPPRRQIIAREKLLHGLELPDRLPDALPQTLAQCPTPASIGPRRRPGARYLPAP